MPRPTRDALRRTIRKVFARVVAPESPHPELPWLQDSRWQDLPPWAPTKWPGAIAELEPDALVQYLQTNLGHADLSRADLESACLQRARLVRACVRNANVNHADLRDANLRNADLRWSSLIEVSIDGADLHGARLDGADVYWRREL